MKASDFIIIEQASDNEIADNSFIPEDDKELVRSRISNREELLDWDDVNDPFDGV